MKKFILSLGLLACAATAQAQTVTISDETSGSPGTQAVTVSYEAGSDLASFSVRIDFDSALLDPQTDTAANPNVDGCLDDLPGTHTGAFTGCNNPTAGAIALTVTDQLSGTVLPTTGVGTITFDVASGITPGTIIPIEMTFLSATTDTGAALTAGDVTLVDGSITVEIPPGESFYSSTPAIGENVDFGSAVVGQTTADQIIAVSNLQTDGTTTFDITGASGTNGGATIGGTVPGGTATVPADGGATEVDVAFNCTPTARGDQAGTLAIDNDSDNANSSAGYTYACTGLSPNVAVSTATVNISGSTADATAPTGSFDITNVQDGFASNAPNAALAESGTAEISITGGLADATINVGETDTVTLECDNSAAGSFMETITLTYDDPVAAGSIPVTVECDISDIAPGYSSDPAVPGPLAFGQVANGDSSTLPINIGNENSIGSGAQAELEITGATLSDSTNYSFAPSPFTATLAASAPNGTESLEVSCNPQSIGDFSGATLTVETNDGDQVYNLTCEGTSNAELQFTPASAENGTLNLGTVSPGASVRGSLVLSNAGTDPLNVSCTLTNNNGGVIVFDPMPTFPVTLPPDATLTFVGTPPSIDTFEETLECTATEPADVRGTDQGTFTTVVSVSGRPLVIPTMSRWSLVVMSLMLLLVGGFATRRMMA